MAFLAAFEAAMYMASMLELGMLDCFTLLQLMAPPPKVNTYPEVDFLKSISVGSQSRYTPRVSDSHLGKSAYNLSFSEDT